MQNFWDYCPQNTKEYLLHVENVESKGLISKTHMKRFLLFLIDEAEPCGGAYDLHGNYDTINECYKHAAETRAYFTKGHILDTITYTVVVEHLQKIDGKIVTKSLNE